MLSVLWTLLCLQEKQAERAKAEEPKPLTDTQLAWQKLQQERAEQDQHQLRPHGPAAPAAPLYTITWQIRLTSLSNIPLPWAAN